MAVAEGAGGGVAEAVIVGKGFSPASLSFKGKEFRGWGGGGEGEGVEQGIWEGATAAGEGMEQWIWEGATVAGGGGEEMVAKTSSCFPLLPLHLHSPHLPISPHPHLCPLSGPCGPGW